MQTQPRSAPRPTVLLVEDDASVRASIAFALTVDGFEVIDFASAEAVLARDDLPTAAALVLDEKLPGMQGLDLLQILRDRHAAPAAILITTATPQLAARAKAMGVVLIEKPLVTDALAAEVRRLARQGSESPSPG